MNEGTQKAAERPVRHSAPIETTCRDRHVDGLRSSKALEQNSEQQRHVRDHREPELVFGEILDA
jgi:hypothetical protein